jgi:hypothetical protein
LNPGYSYENGRADQWQQTITDWQAAGASHITLNTMSLGFDTPHKHIAAITQFAADMLS